jgi:hypothetical protein
MSAKVTPQAKFWLGACAAAFAAALVVLALLAIARTQGWISGPSGEMLLFTGSLALGVAVAAFAVGALRARAAISGVIYGFNIQLGGALAAVAVTVLGAYFFAKSSAFVQPIYLTDAQTKASVLSGEAELVLRLDSGPLSLKVGESGFLEFRNLPAVLLGQQVDLDVRSNRYELPPDARRIVLTGKRIDIALKNKRGGPMWAFRRRLVLEAAGLLAPLRSMAGNDFNGSELIEAHFTAPKALDRILAVDLMNRQPDMTEAELRRQFIFLGVEPTWRQELLSAKGSFQDRIARSALRFADFHQSLSMLDRSYLSPSEMEAFEQVRTSMYVERMKKAVAVSPKELPRNLIRLEMESFFERMEHLNREIGPFEGFF